MKSMRIAAVFAVLVLGMPLLPLLAQNSAATATPQASHAGMMVPSCEHHQAMTEALASIDKLVADNKGSKDVATLQGVLKQIGSQVTTMQDGMKKCAGMMDMMKMDTMKKMNH